MFVGLVLGIFGYNMSLLLEVDGIMVEVEGWMERGRCYEVVRWLDDL